MFHDYLQDTEPKYIRQSIIDLFHILDTKPEERDPYLDRKLLEFPYVNGGMFSDNNIEIPQFTEEIKDLILSKASDDFDWSKISPTVFGSVFEGTLNPEVRRKGGMHYTSIENIHKVIDPLFLDDLKQDLNRIKQYTQPGTIHEYVKKFQQKLSSLTVFDPACGSGNFLTETFLSLRKLENEAIKLDVGTQSVIDTDLNLIQVSIHQFYGIEINDFAVSVAKTALWIAESQMFEKTLDIIYSSVDFLPLKTYSNIIEGNALQLDWNEVVKNNKISYIISNPPFIGARLKSTSQKNDLYKTFGTKKGIGNLDYVSGWYYKSAQFSHDTGSNVALVSTNSITQGEQVSFLWNRILNQLHMTINYAYRTFTWNSEISDSANVHVVIISFSKYSTAPKLLFDNGRVTKVKKISPYLIEADNILVESRTDALNAPRAISDGSMPNDDRGKLSKYTTQQVHEICQTYPMAKKYFRPFLGAQEYLHEEERWCLWLKDADDGWRRIKPIASAVKAVKTRREQSSRTATHNLAQTPYLFGEIRQPETTYLIIPRHSAGNRRYIPMSYKSSDIIAGDSTLTITNASLFEFGILMSNVHMAWVRAIAGRIKSDYRYSNNLVYNNFPWPTVSNNTKLTIEKTAQAILDNQKQFPNRSMDSLYDDIAMPPTLIKAHQDNDRAVMKAYGMDIKTTKETDAVKILLNCYKTLAHKKNI